MSEARQERGEKSNRVGEEREGKGRELRKPDLRAQSKVREIISSFAAFSMRTRPPEKQCDGLHQNGFHRLR